MSGARRLKREPDQKLMYTKRFGMATARSFMTRPTDESSLRVSSVQNCPDVRHGVVTTSHHITQNINTIQ